MFTNVETEQGRKLVGNTYGHDIVLVNPDDRSWTKHKYVLWFGAYGWTRLMVWANSLDDAFDEAVDWCVDHAPGLLCDEQVEEAYREALAEHCEGCDCTVEDPCDAGQHKAWEASEVDTSCGGNYGNRVLSHEWGMLAEDPTREDLAYMLR